MVQINSVAISPPLINSSCAWSSELDQLQALYDSPYTGAVTTRTATLNGFAENESHTVAFTDFGISSINSYGYSPHPLEYYLSSIEKVYASSNTSRKPFIISITTSDPGTLREMVQSIQDLRTKLNDGPDNSVVAIELNTSCPNIVGSPPSGYSFPSLLPLLQVFKEEVEKDPSLTVGLKLPPYVYSAQFTAVIAGLKELCYTDASGGSKCSISFLTCTNTLGNTLAFADQATSNESANNDFAVPSALGGSAGDTLHSLALGNVFSFKRLLSSPEAAGLQDIQIIGVGGVTSYNAAERMRKAGASVVGSATLFGKLGVDAFKVLSHREP